MLKELAKNSPETLVFIGIVILILVPKILGIISIAAVEIFAPVCQ